MTEIIWRKEWQLDHPIEIPVNADGSVAFGDPVGDLFLPSDYLGFMQVSDGAALRDRGSWFFAQFLDRRLKCQVEWLGGWRNLRLGTRSFYFGTDPEFLLPKTYANIGYAEPALHQNEQSPFEVVMSITSLSLDYGKVYIWSPSHDPWMTGTNTRGLGFVADSFAAFMNGLEGAPLPGIASGFSKS
jgi:hypothetical protein